MKSILATYHLNKPKERIFTNLSPVELIEKTVKLGRGVLSDSGALVVHTGARTGRSANDKYCVVSDYTENLVDWKNSVNRMSFQQFESIRGHVVEYLNSQDVDLYISERSVGAQEGLHLEVTLLTSSPSHALFAHWMFREPSSTSDILGAYTILHAPDLNLDAQKFGTKSGTAIIINFESREVIVTGTLYAGEIKKAIFSVMNFALPDLEVLPMHSGANVGHKGDVSLFFGLSGTGKTTLSTDEGRKLIGDDEHGLSSKGTFNFEGGCYAKTYKLSEESEPEIYHACQRFGALLENVAFDPVTRKVDFNDKSITENGRASYPLSFIPDVEVTSVGSVPNHIFFLSADAFGVLPAVSKLTPEQAMFYFLSGYTAKLAGTELGVTEPTATFSHCFGAPFMMRKPVVYAHQLKKLMQKHQINIWLINTGWTGGAYGTGHRFPIETTRSIIRAIQEGSVEKTKTIQDEIFGFMIPEKIAGVSEEHLFPWLSWKDRGAYHQQAKKLALMFHQNFKKFENDQVDILSGSPLFKA